jgi:Mg-chelatase subunit ChlD
MKTLGVLTVAVALFAANVIAQQPDPLTLEREQQTGTAITILFDNSGSMKGEKIQQAKSAFRSWLQSVPADYKFSLITFEGKGKLDVPLGERTRDLVAQKVAQLEAYTGTPICGALQIAQAQIATRRREVTPYERHVVLIFTDGKETTDPRGEAGVQQEISTLRRQTVEVVGVGFHGEGDYMNGVATRFALANNEQELKRGLAKVDAEVGTADDLVVTPEDLAALKKFHAEPPLDLAASDGKEVVETESAATVPEAKKQVPWILLGLIVFFAIRKIAGPKRQRR